MLLLAGCVDERRFFRFHMGSPREGSMEIRYGGGVYDWTRQGPCTGHSNVAEGITNARLDV